MTNKELSEDPGILEAVDNLSSMAELNLEELGAEKGDEEKGVQLRSSRWLDPKNEEKTVESVKSTLKVVHNYLKHIYTKETKQFKDKEMQGGVKSIIALANEAVKKIDQCSSLFQKGTGTSIASSKEFRDLIDFYEKKILKRFEETLSSEEKWEEELSQDEDVADIQRRGLKDLETVTRDRDYELFYITKEDGSKFYNRNLIRHIRLVSDFDQIISDLSKEDPLLRIKAIEDHELCLLAGDLKRRIHEKLSLWLKKAGKYRDDPFVQTFFQGIMALFLAANPRNMVSYTTGKSSFSYFNDFKLYLRRTLESMDYQNLVESMPEEIDVSYDKMLEIIHDLCFMLFTYEPHRGEAFALFLRMIDSEKKSNEKSKHSSLSLWNQVLDDYDLVYRDLQKYPSGPLFKVLDLLQDEGSGSFDPYMQGDMPAKLYVAHVNGRAISVIQMASPTVQKQIDKAKIIPEFYGAIRHALHIKEKFLMINFQDRTSWKEYARSKALEEWQKEAEVQGEFEVVTLPKNTDFYLQSDEYIKQSKASEFKAMLFEQLKSEEECGFSFPKSYDRKKIHEFAKQAIEVIDKVFFGSKETYSRKNRLDFIEIFYQIIILHCLVMHQANYLLFTAKDSVDLAPTALASFFAFIKLIKGDALWKEEEKDLFISMLFVPALLIRERTVDIRPLNRAIGMLSVVSAEIELDVPKVQKGIDFLFAAKFTKGLALEGYKSV